MTKAYFMNKVWYITKLVVMVIDYIYIYICKGVGEIRGLDRLKSVENYSMIFYLIE